MKSRALVLAAALSGSGCALILGLQHDDGDGGSIGGTEAGVGQTERREGASRSDGSATHGDATLVHPRDGGGGGAPDALPADTGGKKDSPAPPPACRGFCACVDAQFCADFDDAGPLQAFSSTSVDGGSYAPGVLRVVDTESVSSPNSLFTQLPDGGYGSVALVTYESKVHGAKYDLRFDMLVGACDLSGALTDRIASVSFSSLLTATLLLGHGDGGTALLVGEDTTFGGPSYQVDYYLYVTPGIWSSVQIVSDPTAAAPAVTVSVVSDGGAPQSYIDQVSVYLDAAPPANAFFILGQNGGSRCTVYIDNVTFDVLP